MVSKHSERDPGCSSRIRILIFYPSRIPDPGVKRHPIPDPDPQHCWRPYLDARQRGLQCGAGEQLGAREGAEVRRQLLVDPALHVAHRRLQVEVEVAILMGPIFRSASFIGSIGIVNPGLRISILALSFEGVNKRLRPIFSSLF
jgi:hypothetical protein